MSDSKLHLMSFVPKPGVRTTVHVVGLPAHLKAALFRLLPPPGENACLRTMNLKDNLRCWLDQAVELNPVYPGGADRDWLVALAPVNLGKLCSVIAVWVSASCDSEAKGSPAFREVIELLRPETFKEAIRVEEVSLFDEAGKPTSGLTFPAFSAQVANAIVGDEFVLPNGRVEVFSRVSRGTSSAYELMSEIHWHKDSPWAFVLRFHVETLPAGRAARLNMNLIVRRFICGTWQDKLYIKDNVNALVRTDIGTYRVVPYGYNAEKRCIDWDEGAYANYRFLGKAELPPIRDYLADMVGYARDGSSPQILSPFAVSATWASDPDVASGASVVDKAMFFEAAATKLDGIVTPVQPLESLQMAYLRTAFEEPKQKEWERNPVEAAAKQRQWARSNRARLAKCTGMDKVVFQLVGESADAHMLDLVRQEIARFLGGEGLVDGFEVVIESLPAPGLLDPLGSNEDSAAKVRWRMVARALGEVSDLTACIVVLPGAKKYREGGGDPKQALRIGFAKTGRLTQFLMPEDPKDREDSPDIRACVAVRDVMRQLGFVPEPADSMRGIDVSVPVVGLTVYSAGNGKKPANFPYCVRQDTESGLVSVDCPLFAEGRLPYWRALLEFARLSAAEDFPDYCKQVGGAALKAMVGDMVCSASDGPELLLVQARGRIRQRDWWPGISDTGLGRGYLDFGPAGNQELLDFAESELRVLRLRSGADGEVPDWFTDEAVSHGSDGGAMPNRRDKQGIFKMDGYILALAPRPGDAQYKWSPRSSKYDSPYEQYCEKNLNEYCLLSPGDENEALANVKYAEALRGCMVQLYKSDMRVNLPAPLHLADRMEEYVWAWDKRRKRKGKGR